MMKENLNMPLRTKILEMALTIESCMSKILLTYLYIDKEETRTLSNRSTSLSFKHKIDLLYDLDILTKEENAQLLLLMEFRNQFLHNIDCSTFSDAVLFLKDQKKKLLKFDDLDSEVDLEFRLENALSRLYISSLDLVVQKFKARHALVEKKNKIVTVLMDYFQFAWDNDSRILNDIMDLCSPKSDDTVELLNLKTLVYEIIDNGGASLENDSHFLELKLKMDENLDAHELRKFFR